MTSVSYGAAFVEGAVQADGLTIRYFRAGAGETLVVLHSLVGLRFSPALDRLAERHDVILFVAPGWGEEPDGGREQSLAELGETIYQATQALGVDRFHVLGSALGADVALAIALDHPENVTSMILEAPGTFAAGLEAPPPIFTPEEAMRAVRAHPEREPAFEPPDPATQARIFELVIRLMGANPNYQNEVAERLPDNAVPTLVIFGEMDGVVSPDSGRTFARVKPNCSFVLLHDAAHDAQGDRGEDFAELVNDFLTSAREFRLPPDATLVTA